MAITTSTLQYLIKRYYSPDFNEDFIYNDNEILKKFYANRMPAYSREVYAPLRLRFASGSTSGLAEGASHPTAAQPTDYYVLDNMKIIDTHKEISQLVINLTKNGKYNYRKALDDLAVDALNEHGDFLNRAMFAEAGYMGTCASASNATTIVLGTGTNMDQFYVGQAVAVLVKSTGATTAGTASDTIATITPSSYTITLTTGVATYGSIDTTYGVCGLGNVSGSTNYLPHSLYDLIGTGNIHSVTVSSYPEFVSYTSDLSSADIGLDDIQAAIDGIELHSKGKVDMLLMHDGLYRQIQFDIVEPQTYRAPGDGAMGTGPIHYRGRSRGRIPIYISAYCNPIDRVYVLDSSAITPYHGAWMEWMDDDGKYISKVSGSRKYEASLGTEVQNIITWRSRTGYIDNANLS